jgi:outer membrane autotransporter protein
MNRHSRLVLPAVAAGLLLSLPARAADYEPPIVVEAPEVPVEVGSGWYLRGDVAYSFDRTEVDFSGLAAVDESRVDFGGDGGVGYHFTDYLRGDVTLAFLSRDRLTFDNGVDFAQLETQSWNGMANAYLDLGTYSGFTPYVGVGLGILYTHNTFEADTAALGSVDLENNQSKFAYSVGAGVAYQVARNWSLDLGYLYTSSPNTELAELTPAGLVVDDDGVDFNQIRVGLRYDLW